jgi:6-phosphogluconolactonase
MPTADTNWLCPGDAEAVATHAAAFILQAARDAIDEHGSFRLVLAGGTTPQRVYRLLAQASADWSHWQIYYGDERCLPADDAERNSHMADIAWLGKVEIPLQNIYPIPAELGAETAATQYSKIINAARPFDLVLLGMGEDGHTASLFPGQQHQQNEPVHAVHDAPKPPPDRVSLSRDSLSDSREVMILITGAGKRTALAQWRAGEQLPIATITARQRVIILTDTAATAQGSSD